MRDSLLRGHRVRSISLQFDICRDAIGVWSGRGHLLALGYGRGTYEADVQCEALELRDAAGVKDQLIDREPARRIISVRRGSRPGNS